MASRELSFDSVFDHALLDQSCPSPPNPFYPPSLSRTMSLCDSTENNDQKQHNNSITTKSDQTNTNTITTKSDANNTLHQYLHQYSISLKQNNNVIQQLQQSFIHQWNNIPLLILCNVFFYLSPCDRLSASSTCTSWRNVIYHSSLWPRKQLQVNLCSHKFTVPCYRNVVNNCQQKSGFDAFTLCTPMVNGNFSKRNEKCHRRASKHNFNEHLKSFIQKCSPFLTGLTIYFDPNSSYNVIDLIKILKHMSDNEIAIYDINSDRSNIYANCRNLKSLILIPVTPLVRCAYSEHFISLYYGLTDVLRYLFSKCQFLKNISLGELHELVYSTDEFIDQFLKSGHEKSLSHLHLSSIKGDIFRYIPHYVSFKNFEKFCALQHLSIDFDVLDTNAIKIFCKLKSLQSLIINVHRVNRHHPGIKKDAWSQLVATFVLNVTVNLLHTESNQFDLVLESLLNTDLPVKVFRAYYLEFNDQAQTLMCNLLEILALRHNKTLETLVLVENLARPKRYLKSNSPNALVMFTWQCRKLQDLSVVGMFNLTNCFTNCKTHY